jgi:hypothetical protein
MAATATEIANLAIAHLGGRALTALSTDTTQQAASLRKWYNPDAGTPVYTALDEALRAHPWNFATARKRQTVTYQTLTGAAVTNEGGLVKITLTAHGYVTGDRVYVKDVVGVTVANGQWYVTRIDNNNFTLDESVFAGTYTNDTGSVVVVEVDTGRRFALSAATHCSISRLALRGTVARCRPAWSQQCAAPGRHAVFSMAERVG